MLAAVRHAIGLAAVAALGAAAIAAPEAPPEGPLTVGRAVELALARDARIVSLQRAVEAARAARGAALDIRDPEVRVTFGTVTQTETGFLGSVSTDVDQMETSLRLFPPNPAVVAAERRRGMAAIRKAEADLEAMKRLVAVEVKTACLELRYLEEDLRLNDRLAALRGEAQEALRARLSGGAALADETMIAALKRVEALGDRARLEREAAVARGQLAALVGRPAAGLAAPAAESAEPLPAESPALADPEATARAVRWDVEALRLAAETVRLAYRSAVAERVPWVSHVQGSVSEEEGPEGDEAWAVQVALSLPLFTWVNRADNALRAEWLAAEAQYLALGDAAAQAARAAADAVRAAAAQQAQIEAAARPLLAEMERSLADARARTDIDPRHAARLEETALAARRALLDAARESERALLALEAALGVDPALLARRP